MKPRAVPEQPLNSPDEEEHIGHCWDHHQTCLLTTPLWADRRRSRCHRRHCGVSVHPSIKNFSCCICALQVPRKLEEYILATLSSSCARDTSACGFLVPVAGTHIWRRPAARRTAASTASALSCTQVACSSSERLIYSAIQLHSLLCTQTRSMDHAQVLVKSL